MVTLTRSGQESKDKKFISKPANCSTYKSEDFLVQVLPPTVITRVERYHIFQKSIVDSELVIYGGRWKRWDHTLRFSPALLEELRFWYSNIDSFNGYSLRPPPDSSAVIFSDASDVAFGGFSASLDGGMASGMFTSEDLGQSSTYHAKWGPHTFHRFATYYNAQLPRFNSKFASPGCSGVDALAQDWSAENNWICPPVSLIVNSVRHLMSCSGRGTLIIPEWPSAHFWPFLREGSPRFSSYVAEMFVLPAVGDLLLEGPCQKQIYKSRPFVFRGCPKFRMLALRLDFRGVV
ncbi:uncharacterized protein LOC111339716 [Stylophora pistillata]|uniref:uncharacterized protein LOC111339716 n=1 Tax=Stylophora pistillata TaxID=50429 RepID=UPI000C046CCE|nr:uncharacterized protein LOC111339716 [Stylophora pistillata]